MKKGRHRRYEEARKFKQRSAESSIEDIDLDDDSFFRIDDDEDDPWADLAAKYNSDDDEDDEDEL